jgi:F-type H+-transporting ATPase subunit delta
MAAKAYPQRYARAVFELALEQNELDRWQQDLQKLAALVANDEFRTIMESPKVKAEDKNHLIQEVLGAANPLALNLARLLVARTSIGLAGRIAAEYQRLLDEHHGVIKADVITAVPLDDADTMKLAADLGEMVGKKIDLTATVQPDILGGIVARVGGKLLDGSTRSKLAQLKRQLASGEKRR